MNPMTYLFGQCSLQMVKNFHQNIISTNLSVYRNTPLDFQSLSCIQLYTVVYRYMQLCIYIASLDHILRLCSNSKVSNYIWDLISKTLNYWTILVQEDLYIFFGLLLPPGTYFQTHLLVFIHYDERMCAPLTYTNVTMARNKFANMLTQKCVLTQGVCHIL